MYVTYILECADKTFYIGSTNDLDRRVRAHNTSKSGAHYTKIRRPVVLKYYETFPTFREARMREAQLKTWSRKEKERLVKETLL